MRLHRSDPLLNDAIAALDLRLVEAKKMLPKSSIEEQTSAAWTLLSPIEISFIKDEIAHCIDDRVYYLGAYHVIQPEMGILTCLHPLYDHQSQVETTLQKNIVEDGQSRIIVLKPRQSGLTEYCNGCMCWRTFFVPHAYTISVAQAPDVAAHIQRKVGIAFDHLPWWMRPERQYHTKGEFTEYNRKDLAGRSTDPGLGSVFVTTHAMRETGVAIGRCQVPETVVWTEIGPLTLEQIYQEYAFLCPNETDDIGEWYPLRRPLRVYSSDGGAPVLKHITRIYRQKYTGPIQHVKVEGGVDICKTPEHAVLVEDEWKKSLSKGDYVSRLGYIPRSTNGHCLTYPDEAELIGWQLAEGHENKNGMYITQKCDVTRKHIVDLIKRVAKPDELINHPADGRINKYGDEYVGYVYAACKDYRRSLVARGFGWGSNWTKKRIPDFIFSADDACVAAFLRGFFEADGSVSHVIDIGQMSKGLMEGLRFLLARLGITLRFSTVQKKERRKNRRHYDWTYYRGFIGGPSLVKFYEKVGFISDRKQARLKATAEKAVGTNTEVQVTATRMIREGVLKCGTTCKWVCGGWKYKEQQMLTMQSARLSLAKWRSATVKLPTMQNDGRNIHFSFRNFDRENSLEWIGKVEKELAKERTFDLVAGVTEKEYDGVVYDLEVEDTHNYTVAGLITHNTVRSLHCSEVSRWPSGEVYTGDIEPSMNAPDSIAFMESTAFGNEGFYYNMWEEAMDGDSDWTPVFLAAYRAKKYSLPLKPSQLPFKLDKAEQAFTEKVKREEKFQISNEFWNWRRRRIKSSIARTGFPYAHYESYPITPQEAFQSSGQGAFPRHKLDEQQQANVCNPIWVGEIGYQGMNAAPKLFLNHMLDADGNYKDIALEKRELTNRFYLWEMPDPREAYYAAFDVGDGIVGGDFSVGEVMRAGHGNNPDVQVGEWVGYEAPIAFAKVAYAIGFFFNRCEIAVEYAREGMTTANELMNVLEYPNIYRPRNDDRLKGQFAAYMHWQTTSKTKPGLLVRMNETLLEDQIIIRSQYLLDELRRCVKDGITFSGLGGHDDAAVSACICLYCLRQTMPEMRVQATSGDAGNQTPTRDARLTGGACVYGIYDSLYRLRSQTPDLLKAQAFVEKNPSYQIKKIMVSKANTSWSEIHNGNGLANELYKQHGMNPWDITPQMVTQFAEATGRLTQNGLMPRPGGVSVPGSQLGARVDGGDAEYWSELGGNLSGGTEL